MWRPDGAVFYFNKNFDTGVGWVMGDADIDGVIASDGATVWTFTDANDTVETYGYVSGKLLSIRTRSGCQQNLTYDSSGNLASVTDSYNRTLTFTYANGVLQTMNDPDGRVYTYGYDAGSLPASGRVIQVTYLGVSPSPTVQYLYENPNFPYALTGVVDKNGNRAAEVTSDMSKSDLAELRERIKGGMSSELPTRKGSYPWMVILNRHGGMVDAVMPDMIS
jgi:YD repeat-containing protein